MNAKRRSCPRGYTLVEMVIVVLVLAIAAAVVIPSIGTAAEGRVTSAARILSADVETARSMALTTQVPHTLLFNDARTAYKVVANYAGASYDSVIAVPHPIRRGQRYEVVPAALNGMAGVTISAVNFGGHPYVTFNTLGEPSAGGTVAMTAGEFHMVVTVEPLTGVVTVD